MLLSFSHLVIVFVIYSILGWIIEALLESLINSRFLNRGLLFGPWMPSYGIGAVIILIISSLLIDFPILVFLSSALIGTLIYNLMGLLLEKTFFTHLSENYKGFDKQKKKVLIHGILQGVFGVAIVYGIHPKITDVFVRFIIENSRLLSGILFTLMGFDFMNSISSISNMNNKIEEMRRFLLELEELNFSWYDSADKVESINRLREIVNSEDYTTSHEVEKAIYGRIQTLRTQFFRTSRIIKAYPNIKIKGYEEEFKILNLDQDLRREILKDKLPKPVSTLWTDTEDAWSTLSFEKLVWIFTVSSVAGYIVERIYAFVYHGTLESRQGLLYGPFSPVYGIGALALTITILPIMKEKNFQIFISGGIIGGLLEAALSYLQEMAFGSVSWDYSGQPFSILGGRTSLRYMVFWGLLSIFYIRKIYPWIKEFVDKLLSKFKRIVTIAWTILLSINIILSSFAVYRWSERLVGEPPSNQMESWIDKTYPDNIMEEVYANMTFR